MGDHGPVSRSLDRLPLVLACLLLGACGGEDAVWPPSPAAHTLGVLPDADTTLGIGQSQFTHAEYDTVPPTRALRLSGHDLQWSSSRPEVAAVDAAGVVVGRSVGETTVTARYGELVRTVNFRVAGRYSTQTVAVPGQGLRTYSLWAPETTSAATPPPLMLALHGAGGSAAIQASMTLLTSMAAREGFVVAFLEGTGFVRTFNAGGCCGYAQSNDVDDVGYASAVIDELIAGAVVDPARIYATGFSNGAMMAHRLACALSDRLAAIAAVSGTPVGRDASGTTYHECRPVRPIPVLHVHATNDRIVPFNGGESTELPGPQFLPVREAIREITVRNNLAAQYVATSVTATTTCYRYDRPADPLRASAPVELCELDPADVYDPVLGTVYGGGHSWPGGLPSPASGSDIPVRDFVVNEWMWGFLAAPGLTPDDRSGR